MPPLSAARAANAAFNFSSSRPPVAVFVGGTSGVGQAMSHALARYTQGTVQIMLCGRNHSAAEATINAFPKPQVAPPPAHAFVEGDLLQMRNVQATTSSLRAALQKVNYLVLSTGSMDLRWRDETPEGLDKRLALNYYARWKVVRDLLPLLRAATDAGEDARVMSVLGPGSGWRIDLNDLGLRRRYNPLKALASAATYNDLMIESFAEREPRASFVHAFPGLVRTPLMGTLGALTLYPLTVSPDVCAEHMLYALLHSPPGASRRDSKGDDMGKKRYYGSEEARRRLWEHTVEVDRAINAGTGH